jgi:dTDP-4-amino-4,6-dideoxygalactose transaminase
MPPYSTAAGAFPNTEVVSDRVMTLPTGTAVNDEDIDTICTLIRLALSAIRERGASESGR